MVTTVFQFRDYASADEQQMVALFDEFQDYIVGLDPLHLIRRLPGYGQTYLAKTLQKVSDHDGKFLLAVDDKTVIGFVMGTIKSRHGNELLEETPYTYGEVVELYVAARYRGTGIGTQLMRHIEDYFAKKNCAVVFIEVFAPNTNAQNFYKKHGYGVRDVFLSKELLDEK
jgi:ribosomal protein S18 acetylase RimI-like enzyme